MMVECRWLRDFKALKTSQLRDLAQTGRHTLSFDNASNRVFDLR